MLTDAVLLDVHDRGAALGALGRAVLLADATGTEDAAGLPVDVRDRRILSFAAALDGDRIGVTLTCIGCGEPMDAALSATKLAMTGEPANGLRVPTSRDLGDALALADDDARRRLLAARAAGLDPATLDLAAVDAIEARLEAAAGPEDVQLAYRCPACGQDGVADFDPAAHAWCLLATRAHETTATVAQLARAYGWSEAEVLALTPERRARYRELAA